MHKFSEELLQFIWKHKLLKPMPFISHTGNEIEVVNYGELNSDSGPDFFNAQIRVNGLILAGNIELHIRSSDWIRHRHQNDRSYDNIILHVVFEHDMDLAQNLQHQVEVLELKRYIEPSILQSYTTLVQSKDKLPCHAHLKQVDDFKFMAWMERLKIERLEYKINRLEQWFQYYGGDYSQTFYISLLRNFGFKVNALPFELLAHQLPLKVLLRHSDNSKQLEALLLGTSGMLEVQLEADYLRELQNEFQFLSKKYGLLPLKKELFKYSKLRPSNFPSLRLAQLAALIHKNPELLSEPQNFTNKGRLRDALCVSPEDYWKHHYSPDGVLHQKELGLGESSAENIIINTMAPFFFFYAKKLGKEVYQTYCFELLETCQKEENAVLKLFSAKQSLLQSAAGSQAAIQLYDNYCKTKSCLNCGIGLSILKGI